MSFENLRSWDLRLELWSNTCAFLSDPNCSPSSDSGCGKPNAIHLPFGALIVFSMVRGQGCDFFKQDTVFQKCIFQYKKILKTVEKLSIDPRLVFDTENPSLNGWLGVYPILGNHQSRTWQNHVDFPVPGRAWNLAIAISSVWTMMAPGPWPLPMHTTVSLGVGKPGVQDVQVDWDWMTLKRAIFQSTKWNFLSSHDL